MDAKYKWPQKSLCVSKAIIEGNFDINLSPEHNSVLCQAFTKFVLKAVFHERDNKTVAHS